MWLVPGSPYADDDYVLSALTTVHASSIPFLAPDQAIEFLMTAMTPIIPKQRDRWTRVGHEARSLRPLTT